MREPADRLAAVRAAARPASPIESGWAPAGDDPSLPEASSTPAPVPMRSVRPVAAVAAALLAVVVGVVAWLHAQGEGDAVQLAPRSPSSSPAAVVPGPSPASGPIASGPVSAAVPSPSPVGVVVDVEGRVHRPGLQRLPPGARLADAVQAAGGVTSGAVLRALNLARILADGEQIVVPGPGDPAPVGSGGGGAGVPSPGGAGTGAGGAATPVDLNAATEEGLDTLPGVGPVLAQRIVAWRTEHGRFTSVDELAEVPGIGPKLLERLRPLVRV
jgi:competence protein ComEA